MFRKLFFLVFTTLIFVSVQAQIEKPQNTPVYDRDPLHFGFTLGLSTMDFGIRLSDDFYNLDTVLAVNNKRLPGFNIAMITNLRMGEFFDLRFLPGLVFGQRDLIYERDIAFVGDFTEESNDSLHIMKIESTFLQFPLQVKYKAQRVNNYRPYLIAGVNYCFDLEAQKRIKDSERPKIRLKRHDVYWEIGFGIDYYFPFFKLSSEVKFSVGMLDMIQRDTREYTTAIDKLNSKMVTFQFHFE
jgi:Outer membrane protein beta-barrel domain